MLGPDGAPLRTLVASEAIRVTEALLLGSALESLTGTGPTTDPLNSSSPREGGGSAGDGLLGIVPAALVWPVQQQIQTRFASQLSEQSVQDMLELRAQVLRCWVLLRSNRGFDLSTLSPLVQASTLPLPLWQPLAARARPLFPLVRPFLTLARPPGLF